MISFRNLSIPNKIVAIIMIICGAALLLTSGALIAYDFSDSRRELRLSVSTFAGILADNMNAAVSFDDKTTALDTLSSLRPVPSVVAACIYTPDGLFTQRVFEHVVPCPARP